MSYKSILWWKKLSQKEKELLIEILFETNLKDLGIIIDENNKYKKEVKK